MSNTGNTEKLGTAYSTDSTYNALVSILLSHLISPLCHKCITCRKYSMQGIIYNVTLNIMSRLINFSERY